MNRYRIVCTVFAILLICASAQTSYASKGTDAITRKGCATHFDQGKYDNDTLGQRDVELIKAAGITLVRDGMAWEHIEKQKNVYDFSQKDIYMKKLDEAGIECIIYLGYNNKLYQTGAPSTDEAISAFARYAAAVARRYPQVMVFEIWNEPDLIKFWTPEPNANDYARLVKAASRAIRNVRNDAKIYAGATSGMQANVNATFMSEFLANDVYAYIDGITMHPYDVPKPVDTSNFSAMLTNNLDVLQQYGGFKDIAITEVGWPTHIGSRNSSSEEKQAAETIKEFVYADKYGVAYNTVYDFRNDGTDETIAEHNFGLIKYDYSLKPVYTTVKQFEDELGGDIFCGRIDFGSTALQGYVYNSSGKPKIFLWSKGTVSENETSSFDISGDNIAIKNMYGEMLDSTIRAVDRNPLYIVGADDKYLCKAAADSIANCYGEILRLYGTKLDYSYTTRNIKSKISELQDYYRDIAQNAEYNASSFQYDEERNLSIGDMILTAYFNDCLGMTLADATVINDYVYKAARFAANLGEYGSDSQYVINAMDKIESLYKKIGGRSDTNAQYALAALKQAQNMSTIAHELSARESSALGIARSYDNISLRLVSWAKTIADGSEKDISIITAGNRVNICGNLGGENGYLSLVVTPRAGNHSKREIDDVISESVYMNQTVLSPDGKYSFDFPLEDGEYTFALNTMDNVYSVNFDFYQQSSKVRFFDSGKKQIDALSAGQLYLEVNVPESDNNALIVTALFDKNNSLSAVSCKHKYESDMDGLTDSGISVPAEHNGMYLTVFILDSLQSLRPYTTKHTLNCN